jgi:hypothetical protein
MKRWMIGVAENLDDPAGTGHPLVELGVVANLPQSHERVFQRAIDQAHVPRYREHHDLRISSLRVRPEAFDSLLLPLRGRWEFLILFSCL